MGKLWNLDPRSQAYALAMFFDFTTDLATIKFLVHYLDTFFFFFFWFSFLGYGRHYYWAKQNIQNKYNPKKINDKLRKSNMVCRSVERD